MGLISDFKAMVGVQRIKNGGKTRLSVSQITALIVNMSDARHLLPEEQFNDVYTLFKRLRKVKKKKRMDITGYYDVSSKIIMRFNMIAPYIMYSGNPPAEAQLLMETIQERYGHLDALALETELFGQPRPKNRKPVVVLSVLLAIFVCLSVYSMYLIGVEHFKMQEKIDLIEADKQTFQSMYTQAIKDKTNMNEAINFWNERYVIVTPTGEKYHEYGCYALDGSELLTYSKVEAERRGYEQCRICNSPLYP